jgi:hypothetical protein
MSQRLAASRAAPTAQPRLQTPTYPAGVIHIPPGVDDPTRIHEVPHPGYADVIRGDELKRRFFKGPHAGREYKYRELGALADLDESEPTLGKIESSRAQTEYKLAQYDLMARQHLTPFMTTTTDAEGAQIRVRSEEGSKLYDKYARMFLVDPKRAEKLLKEETEKKALEVTRTKKLEAMSEEELAQFIADEEAAEASQGAASITEAAEASRERPSPFTYSLSEIAEKRKQEEIARRKRLYGERGLEEGPLVAPRKRLIDWLNRPTGRVY